MRIHEIGLTNAISLSRVALALLFLTCFRNTPGALLNAAVFVAIIAQATDHLDGYLVRKFSQPSVTGWVFDSFADRSFYFAALLAFEREYGVEGIIVWAFILRELALYGVRVVAGEFEPLLPGFRKLALAHAAIVRLGIVMGCIIPYLLPSAHQYDWLVSILSLILIMATTLGYANLWLLMRKLS